MEIRIVCKDKSSEEHFLSVVMTSETTSFNYKGKNNGSFKSTVIKKEIDEYHQASYGHGKPYYERDFLLKFELESKDSIECSLLRVFAITISNCRFSFNETMDKTLLQHFEMLFFDQLHFDWTGDMGIQPFIYMISKDLIIRYSQTVSELYDMGILYKYIMGDEETYFVPFDFTDYPELHSSEQKMLWREIKKAINKAIRRMTH